MDNSGKSYIKIEGDYRDDGLYTITDSIKYFAELKGDQDAFVFADHDGGGGRQSVTFAELYEKSNVCARSLINLGVKKGELIAINLRNCPEWLYLEFGAMFSGAVPVSISFTYKDGSDLIAMMKKLKKCCLMILEPGEDAFNWEIVKQLLNSYSIDGKAFSEKLPSLRYIIGHEVCEADSRKMTGVKTICELMDQAIPAVEYPIIHEDDVAFLLQTSGSTGVPKLVVHTHRSVMSLRQLSSSTFFDVSVRQYNDRPFCWMGGYPMSVLTGQTRVTVSGFSPTPGDKIASLIGIIQEEKCNHITALPPLLHGLLRSQNIPADWPVSLVLTGGQPLNQGLANVIGKVAPSISTGYGGTEFLAVSSAMIGDVKDFRENFCGKIAKMPGLEVKVVDESGEIVTVNTRGEVFVRSPSMFKEYYNDPEKTAAVLTDDHWYKTDDIGMMTKDAELFIYGRISNMIISGGMNVAPEILEQAMKACQGVASVVIVPVPDEEYYQVLCACVVREVGSDLEEEQLRRYCDEIHNDSPRMFTVLPKYYMFFDEFPVTNTGKLKRTELIKIANDTFSSL